MTINMRTGRDRRCIGSGQQKDNASARLTMCQRVTCALALILPLVIPTLLPQRANADASDVAACLQRAVIRHDVCYRLGNDRQVCDGKFVQARQQCTDDGGSGGPAPTPGPSSGPGTHDIAGPIRCDANRYGFCFQIHEPQGVDGPAICAVVPWDKVQVTPGQNGSEFYRLPPKDAAVYNFDDCPPDLQDDWQNWVLANRPVKDGTVPFAWLPDFDLVESLCPQSLPDLCFEIDLVRDSDGTQHYRCGMVHRDKVKYSANGKRRLSGTPRNVEFSKPNACPAPLQKKLANLQKIGGTSGPAQSDVTGIAQDEENSGNLSSSAPYVNGYGVLVLGTPPLINPIPPRDGGPGTGTRIQQPPKSQPGIPTSAPAAGAVKSGSSAPYSSTVTGGNTSAGMRVGGVDLAVEFGGPNLEIRSYDAAQQTIVIGNGQKVGIKPLLKALAQLAPAAAQNPFIDTPGIGALRFAPEVQRILAERNDELRKAGGHELDVTLEVLALLGIPDMRLKGPATLIENPVMISLRRLVAAAKPYADSAEHWRSIPDDIRYPGSFGRVHGYVLDAEGKDLFIIGTPAATPEARLDIDLFSVLMETVWAKGLTPGVSLDPMPAPVKSAGATPAQEAPRARTGKQPSQAARNPEAQTLDFGGPQHARIINLPSDALVSRILLDADYEMKRINFGVVNVGVRNFKSWIDILKGNPRHPDRTTRFWFRPIPLNSNTVRVSGSGRVVLYDAGVQLLAETTKVDRAGLIGIGEVDPLAAQAAEEFTKNYAQIRPSAAARPRGIYVLLQGITDIVTMCKILRESEVDLAALQDLRRLPYRRLSGTEAVRTTYPGLSVRYLTSDGHSATLRGGVDLFTRPTRRSLDRFDDSVATTLERATADFPAAGLMRRVPITFRLAAQQAGGNPATELAKIAGRRLLASNQPEAASQRFRDAAAKDPLDIDAWIYLGLAQARAGHHTEARNALEQARALDPRDSVMRKASFQIALLAARNFQFDAIDPALRRALSYDYAEKAYNALSARDTTAAFENADLAVKLWSENLHAYIARGMGRERKGDLDAAIQDYTQAIRIDPKHALSYTHRADAHRSKAEYDPAIADYNLAVGLDATDASVFAGRADAYAGKGQYQLAIQDYGHAVDLDPEYANAYNSRGLAYRAIKEEDRAIEDFSKAISIDPDFALALYNRAHGYFRKNEYDRAIGDYDEAIRIDPSDKRFFNNRGVTFVQKGNYDSAIQDYDQAIRLDPNFGLAFRNRGKVYYTRKDYANAIRDFGEAIRLDPRSNIAFRNRGDAYLYSLDYDRAMRDYDQAIRLDPGDSDSFVHRGVGHTNAGNYDGAIRDFNEAIRLGSDTIFVGYSFLADAYRKKTDFANALVNYDKAISIVPTSYALFGRGLSNFYSGDFRAAARDMLQANDRDPAGPYPMLWRFLARGQLGQDGSDELDANIALAKTKDWPYGVLEFYLGRRTLAQLLADAASTEQKCQAEFYAGELHLVRGMRADALQAFKTALEICRKDLLEYEGAVIEIKRRRPWE
jgi:tetratricopeptide (TPR) repeat protein